MKLTDHEILRSHILKRIEELGWRDSDLLRDADERGMKIDPSRWSKYRKNQSGQITDETLFWIATRLGIDINIRIGKPVVKEGQIDWVVAPYDELQILKRLKQLYPHLK